MRNTVRKQRKHRKKQTKRVYYGGTRKDDLISKIRKIKTLAQWNTSNINNWDISRIMDLSYVFSEFPKISNEPLLLSWNTEHVTNMKGMFEFCQQNFILDFNTQNVTDMSKMFKNARNFNSPLNFDTSNVKYMSHMFSGAFAFNQPLNFDTSNVKDMSWMFAHAFKFNQPLNFDTSNVKDMSWMFFNAIKFNQPINFDTSKVNNMEHMFEDARSFKHPIYFNLRQNSYISIFDGSPMEGQEEKYVLPEDQYNALILGTMLEKRNPEATLTYLVNTI